MVKPPSAQTASNVRIVVGDANGANRRALPVDGEAVHEVQWYGNDRIAYVIEHGQDGHMLMDLEGKPTGRLAMPAGCDSFFHQCLSPDGQWIVFCGNYVKVPDEFATEAARDRYLKEHPEVEVQHGLFVVNLKQQTVKQLLQETVANLPAWSLDATQLAAGIGHYVSEYQLAIIHVESGEVERPDVQGVGIAWSPDGSQLAMTTDVVRGGSWRGGVPLDGALAVWDIQARRKTLVSPPVRTSSPNSRHLGSKAEATARSDRAMASGSPTSGRTTSNARVQRTSGARRSGSFAATAPTRARCSITVSRNWPGLPRGKPYCGRPRDGSAESIAKSMRRRLVPPRPLPA